MANRHPIIRGLGLLTGFVLVVFAAAFFYAYFTGGDAKALSLLAVSAFYRSRAPSTIHATY
jgi:hypothetical protein